MSDPHNEVPVMAFVPIWYPTEELEVNCANGAVLTAQVSGADVGLIIWTVRRQFEDQSLIIGCGHEESVDKAKAAAWTAIKAWREAMEGGEAPPSILLPPTTYNL